MPIPETSSTVTDLQTRLQAALGGAYRVERELGGGGMGRVFVAEETALGRRVVVKVLPPELGAGVSAERFRREIQVAASLQHPHVVPLLSAGQADDLVWYTMPLIEGQSLREKLTREGELPVGDVVRILRDVADALAFAHERGVVHRDIKPDNVLLSGRHAVVTDFGVAKAISDAAGPALTTAGLALGTPAYMAPEQATASPKVDHRADIYAFGAMAYEMLTGAPPFAGDAQAVLSAHVVEAPSDVSARRAAVSPALGALVMRCLEKKAADRWQSATELHAVLEGMATPSGGTAPTAAAASGRRPPFVAVVLGGVALVATLALFARRAFERRAVGITVSDIRPVSSDPGVEWQPAISPDGKEVAYIAGRGGSQALVLRSAVNVTGGGEVRLADTALGSVWFPRWSPDGEAVRFLACRVGEGPLFGQCTWKEISRLGGSARSVVVPRRASQAAWSADGSRIAFVRRDSIFSAASGDTAATLLAVHPYTPAGGLHSLAWSPDRRRLAYVAGNSQWLASGNVQASSIWVVVAAGGEPIPIAPDSGLNVSPAWLDDRHLLFVSDRDGPRGIFVVEVGGRGVRGAPRSVLGASDVHAISYSSTTRRLAYAKLVLRQNLWSYPIGTAGSTSIGNGRRVTNGNQVIEEHDVSPDGRWIVYDNNLAGNANLYKLALDGGTPVQLTSAPGDEMGPRWSPDGAEIAFYTDFGELSVMPSEGGAAVRLTVGRGSGVAPRWAPNGLQIAFVPGGFGEREVRIMTRDRPGGPWRGPVTLPDVECMLGGWAPDGSGVLCGGLTLLAPSGGVIWRRDLRAEYGLQRLGYAATYSRDGRAVYVEAVHEDGRRGIWSVPLGGGAPRLMVSADDPALSFFGSLSVGPDRLFATVSEYESDVWVMRLR